MKLDFDAIIVFDLEWNGGTDDVKVNEILQIGAVKLRQFDAPIEDTFCHFIKPSIHSAFGPSAQALDFSAEQLACGAPFSEVLEHFLGWCGERCLFFTWGPQDLIALHENTHFFGLDTPLPQVVYDLQAAAGAVVGAQQNIALSAMVEYCGLPDSIGFHDALSDAFYTAQLLRVVTAWGMDVIGLCAYSLDAEQVCLTQQELYSYVSHTGPQYSSVSHEHALLSSLGFCRQRCSECGTLLHITCWFPLKGCGYLAKVDCPIHGSRYFWASLSYGQDALWRGNVHQLTPTLAIQILYYRRDKKNVVICHRRRRRKRKTHYGTRMK